MKTCPHCGGKRFSQIRDVTITHSCDKYGQLVKVSIVDLGSDLYQPLCEKCGKPVEIKDMVDES